MIKLSFKAVNQVLYHHISLINEMQAVLPAKANKSDVHQQMSSKVSILDMKQTMGEIAANIESRIQYDDVKRMLEEKVSRSDLHFQLQNKPSFDDLKQIMDNIHPHS